jgi:hypothetical protein
MGMPSMQDMQNMQHRYPGEGGRERERERERERDRESRRVRGGDAGGYQRDNQGQKVNAPSRRDVEINKQITVCRDSRDLCVLIDAHAAECNNVNVVTGFRKLLQSRREGLPSGVVATRASITVHGSLAPRAPIICLLISMFRFRSGDFSETRLSP